MAAIMQILQQSTWSYWRNQTVCKQLSDSERHKATAINTSFREGPKKKHRQHAFFINIDVDTLQKNILLITVSLNSVGIILQ